ncbi:hypothetical protein QFC21_002111 [Naganishia friedmannii]|uniref:Uncharacterized protein n=1 Tax=Naganishia friedmannii TaxID=89922 RepID=A0ACC2VZQ5_9TREE|nr:hypothetical protein QFC21_002111 [Naganishia friedmannii]
MDDDDDDPLALGPRETVPTSDDDERELERAAEWGGQYWAEAIRQRSGRGFVAEQRDAMPSIRTTETEKRRPTPPDVTTQASPPPATLSSPLTPTPIRRDRTRSPPTASPVQRLAPRPSTASVVQVVIIDQIPPPISTPPPLPQDLEISADLLAFQNARTFRPRTALQLQPYTRERLAYQAVVRRGGGRGLVQELDVVPGSNDAEDEDGVYQLDASEQMEESMIDVAPSPIRTPASQDFATFADRYPEASTPSPTNRDLQALVKRRIRQAEQEERKRKRSAREEKRFAEQLEREIAERARTERAILKEQRRLEKERNPQKSPLVAPARKTYAKRARIHPPASATTPARTNGRRRDLSDLLRGLPREDSSSPSPEREREREPERQPARRIPVVQLDTSSAMEVDNWLEMDNQSPAAGPSSRRPTTAITSDPESEENSSESSDNEGESSRVAGAPLARGKARALKRMLPAFMINRLEKGVTPAAPNARPLDEEENRPGRVKVRNRGVVVGRALAAREEMAAVDRLGDDNGDMGQNDDLGIFADFGSPPEFVPQLSSPPPLAFHFSAPLSPDATISGQINANDRAFSVSSTTSSDADDNDDDDADGADSVRLLHAGQFERLLNGEKETPNPHRKIGQAQSRRKGLLTAARSARGIVRRQVGKKQKSNQNQSRTRGPPQQQQTRLPFPQTAAHRPAARLKSINVPQGRQRKRSSKAAARLLDDRTIFEISDDDELGPAVGDVMDVMEMHAPTPPRPAARTVQPHVQRHRVAIQSPAPLRINAQPIPAAIRRDNAPLPRSLVKNKASLWSDLQDFQVDFDVKPLPSGVSFDASTWIGRGGLEQFALALTAAAAPDPEHSTFSVAVFGMTLTLDMPYSELLQLLPTILNGVYDQLVSLYNGRASTEDYLGSFDFLDRYIFAHVMDSSTTDTVRFIEDWIDRFCTLRSSRQPCPDDAQHLYLLEMAVVIFKLLLRMQFQWPDAASSPSLETSILRSAEDIIERLLAFGFDRTMKPLKAIMAFAADSPVLSGFTAECWITIIHLLTIWDFRPARLHATSFPGSSFGRAMDNVVQRLYVDDQAGPRASERIWYITFGLAAFHQFESNGITLPDLQAHPQWSLVRKALTLIKFPSYPEAEELERRHQLKSRDKYIKIMVIRCLHLTCTWLWTCDYDSFAIATRDLGLLFKERHLRNLPNESSSDFPAFIREYDLKRSSEVDIEESTYNLYLQLVCVSASDLIASARNFTEAGQAVKDVRRLMLAIFPFSPVVPGSNGIFNGRQLGALVNRYSALVVAVLFVPDLLEYLLKAAQKWVPFDCGDLEVQRICLRGLIYVGVAARHHKCSVRPVVERLAAIFEIVHAEKRSFAAHNGDRIREQERLLILLVSCYRQMIERHGFDKDLQTKPSYPDPCLLHTCWTSRLSSTDLITDRRAGIEVIETIQAFLDSRNAALPDHIRSARQQKLRDDESQQSEFDSFGIDFTREDLMMLGEGTGVVDIVVQNEKVLAEIIANHISPGIYELLSNTFTSNEGPEADPIDIADRQTWISKLSKCWADCASVLVVDHHLRDWAFFMGYGKESYERLADEGAKRQVGMSFCLNVLEMDPGAFTVCFPLSLNFGLQTDKMAKQIHREDFVLLFAQGLVARQVTIEHEYASALLRIPTSRDWYLLGNFPTKDWSAEEFMAERRDLIGIMSVNISHAIRSVRTSASGKSFIYRLVNVLLGTMQHNYQSLPSSRLDLRQQYSSFCDEVVNTIKRHNTDTINNNTVIKLKNFPLYKA